MNFAKINERLPKKLVDLLNAYLVTQNEKPLPEYKKMINFDFCAARMEIGEDGKNKH